MQEGSPEPGYAIGVETCVRDVPAGRRGAVWLGWRSLAGEVKYNYTQSRKYDLAYKSIFVGSQSSPNRSWRVFARASRRPDNRGSWLVARHPDGRRRRLELGVEGRQGQAPSQGELQVCGIVLCQAMLSGEVDRVRPRLRFHRRVHKDRQSGEEAEPARAAESGGSSLSNVPTDSIS